MDVLDVYDLVQEAKGEAGKRVSEAAQDFYRPLLLLQLAAFGGAMNQLAPEAFEFVGDGDVEKIEKLMAGGR